MDAFIFSLVTIVVRAVTHTPWQFLLRYRAARAHGFAWRRTLGILAGTYALAYLVGIAVTGGVLWEALVTQGWKAVLPSFAAALAAPLVTHRLLGEVLDSLAADGRPDAKPPQRLAAPPPIG
ncbi:MAG: hypothetical protein NXI21_18975 [Alphaproteobacteria bacterium]|nr:hypothetical protein [Alphaproteobacteria bacterium]